MGDLITPLAFKVPEKKQRKVTQQPVSMQALQACGTTCTLKHHGKATLQMRGMHTAPPQHMLNSPSDCLTMCNSCGSEALQTVQTTAPPLEETALALQNLDTI